jgi:hypothetical protein
MRIELTKLLAQRPVESPSRVKRMTFAGRRLEVLVTGFPWWSAEDNGRPWHPSSITLIFEELPWGYGRLPVHLDDPYGDDLEDFSVVCLADVGWAQPPADEIYCNGPLADPIALYTLLQDRLHDADAFLGPEDLLNQCDRLSEFLRLASGSSFLLARTPAALTGLLRSELDRQQVPYTVLARQAGVESRLWVRFAGGSFLCERAFAEIDVQ